jgi:hypothetical protein
VAYASAELSDGNLASHNLAVSSAQQSILRPNPQSSAVSAQSLSSRIAPLPSFISDAFQKLTNDYEIVLIDTAPILSSAETEYLARCVDVTILVATASRTKKNQIFRAACLLERIDVPGVAAIINEVSRLRVHSSVEKDIRESEARINAANLRWKPKFTPFVVGGSYCNENAQQDASAAEEPVAGLG